MKVGILTYHFVSNFGANLQTLSTFGYFKKNGHEPLIINWIPKDLENYYLKVVPEEQNKAFAKFEQENYTNISKVCRTSIDIANVIDEENLDLVVIGSDAVLTYIPILNRFHLTKKGPKYCKPCIDSDFPNAFWGDFMKHVHIPVKTAIMSGSAQNTYYNHIVFRKSAFKKALKQYDYVSVRDIWTKHMISFLSDNELDVPITPDPVFAFNANVDKTYSREYILRKFGLPENYALLTIDHAKISKEWKLSLEEEFKKQNITLVELPQANKTPKNALHIRLNFPIDPIEWYCLIKYSKAYVGELMHPVLVSLHNSVPVFVIDTYGFKSHKNKYGINPLSSKTFQIMQNFDLLSNYYNLNMNHIIEPITVLRNILSFDKDKCSLNADRKLDDYNKMMDCILSI